MTNENNIPGTWLLLGALFVFLSAWCGRKNFPVVLCLVMRWQVPVHACLRPAFARMHSATPGCAEPFRFLEQMGSSPFAPAPDEGIPALPVLLGGGAQSSLEKIPQRPELFPGMENSLGIAAAYILRLMPWLSSPPPSFRADHAMFSATLLFGIGVLALLRMWYGGIPGAAPRPQITVAVFLALSGICVFSTIHDHLLLFGQHEKRVRLILEQKKAGMQEIIVPLSSPPRGVLSFSATILTNHRLHCNRHRVNKTVIRKSL